jgi:hypothetical protein
MTLTADQLNIANNVLETEIEKWKVVRFAYNNVHAVRACGEVHIFKNEDDARKLARQRAMEAVIAYYEEAVPAVRGDDAALALQEATALARSLFNLHYAEKIDKQVTWQVATDLRGVISQIDNMTAGLIATDRLTEALKDSTAIRSGPNGRGGTAVTVHYKEREHARQLIDLLAMASGTGIFCSSDYPSRYPEEGPLGFDPLGFVEEARAHLKDMPRVIQRDYLAAALDKLEHAAKVLEREVRA